MQTSPNELKLDESYHFQVSVEINNTFYAGEVSLTPNSCTLVIKGDITRDRHASLELLELSEITCDCLSRKLILLGLKIIRSSTRLLAHYPEPVSHFEISYSISHAIYIQSSFYKDLRFIGLELASPSISQWVGYTRTQDDIVDRYHKQTLFLFDGTVPTEFEHRLENLGKIRVLYPPSMHYSVEAFGMGLDFSPLLSLSFDEEKNATQVVEYVNEIVTLFSFVIGRPLNLSTIDLITMHGPMHRFSLYYSQRLSCHTNPDYLWFPLGRNLKIDTVGLPEFPLNSFSQYFKLKESERVYFKKYIKYREMQNPEERFLGFFRLLEKLCYQTASFLPEDKLKSLLDRAQSFVIKYFDNDKKNVNRLLDRIYDINKSKLNTASCITKFMKTLPLDLRNYWIYSIKDIEEICRLRNDLTHANEVEPDDYETDKKATFIEALLTICLLSKIGIPVEDGILIAQRINRHVLIETPPRVVYSTDSG